MSKPAVNIRIARVFEGARHERLEKIWECIAEYAKADVRLHWEANPGPRLSHAQVFERMWKKEQALPERYCLLTEADFLPELGGDWLPTHVFEDDPKLRIGALVTQYYTRNPQHLNLRLHKGKPGGWWVLLDKTVAPADLQFTGKPDPCNQLPHEVETAIMPGEDCYPLHYGVDYAVGTHLFWSRHYHDSTPDDAVISGVEMGDMRAKHDQAVTLWLRAQPAEFVKVLMDRHPDVWDAPVYHGV